MRFYDFMTLVWVVIWAPSVGALVYYLASSDPPKAIALGGFATVGMAVAVVLIRMFRDPG